MSVSGSALAESASISGAIMDNFSVLQVDITVNELDQSEISTDEALHFQHFKIRVGTNSKPIQHESELGNGNPATQNLKYFWSFRSPMSSTALDNNDYTITANIEIKAVSPATLESAKVENSATNAVDIYLDFHRFDGEKFTSTNNNPLPTARIEEFFNIPDQAPVITKVSTGHKSITVNWKPNEQVKYTTSGEIPSISRQPSNVLIFVFKKDAQEDQIKATTVDITTGAKEEAEACRFTPEESSCITCEVVESPQFTYLDRNQSAFKIYSANTSQGSLTIPGLELNTTYTVTAQYLTGNKISSCQDATPIKTFTALELADEEQEATLTDPRCFIATAAYGSDHINVQNFRWFRDHYLTTNEFGQRFIESYYRHSPAFANIIVQHPWLREVSKAALWLPHQYVSLLYFFQLSMIQALILACALTGLAAFLLTKSSQYLIKKTLKT